MDAPDPARRRLWGPASRDAALRRTRRATRVIVVAATGLSGLFSVVAAQAFKGHTGKSAAVQPAPRSGRVTDAPAPQHVPPIAGAHRSLRPPSQAPTAAPTPQAAPAPVPPPAPSPPPPAPVVSGGS